MSHDGLNRMNLHQEIRKETFSPDRQDKRLLKLRGVIGPGASGFPSASRRENRTTLTDRPDACIAVDLVALSGYFSSGTS